ncbi:MAG: methyltransferase domain-containing protein [Pseudomonadota bacterium]|nr:methyltransferase domain-containing protein [Pseudomonadota bacterium]
MSETCELCRRPGLEPVYEAEGSGRGLKIHLCRHCGLLQSLPRIDRAPRREAAPTAGADWGNVRYGKGFRTAAALSALRRHADLSPGLALLDVGSNRGSFARAFVDEAPNAHVLAIEPDERVVESCRGLERTEIVAARIEDVPLETGRFDIVHSCHTIEHLANPARVLADHWRVLKPGGLLVLDAPSTTLLDSDDIVEEWFIDKHLYHFSARTLMRMVTAAGFDIVEPPDPTDRENLLIVACKTDRASAVLSPDPREVAEAERLITAYGAARARNLVALTAMAAELKSLAPRRVAMWGAGRLFDSLVVHGGFMPQMLAGLIDAYLKAHVPMRHGCELKSPDALIEIDPGVVVVMSRGFAVEIADHARKLAPGAEIITYSDLLARARHRRAA